MIVHPTGKDAHRLLVLRQLIAFRPDALLLLVHRKRNGADKRRGPDAGGRARAVHQLPVELLGLRFAVQRQGRIKTHHQQMIRAETGTGRERGVETAVQHGRHHHQHERQSHLGDHQRVAPPEALLLETVGIGGFQNPHQMRAARLERGRQAEQHGAG